MDDFKDDFEFVDNGFDDDDGTFINCDEESNDKKLHSTLCEVNELKKRLEKQSTDLQNQSNLLENQRREMVVFMENARKEIADVSDLKESLKKSIERMEKKKQWVNSKCNVLDNLYQSLKTMPEKMNESKQLLNELKKFSSQHSDLKQQVDLLKNERKVQCKRECLISLEKAKSFSCKECGTDIGLNCDIESKCYQVGQGQFTEKKRGYLFANAVNLLLAKSKTENFTTGSYQISWTSCAKCKTQMGWKYVSADNASNNSKVGKYCLSRYALHSPEDRATTKK